VLAAATIMTQFWPPTAVSVMGSVTYLNENFVVYKPLWRRLSSAGSVNGRVYRH